MNITSRRQIVSRLESLGIRRVSNFFARAFGDDILPPADADPANHTWSVDRLRTTSETARYYAWANIIRAIVYVPLLNPLRTYDSRVAYPILVALLMFHGLCILVEVHRHNLLRTLPPSIAPVRPKPKVKVGDLAPHPFFEPKPWETLSFYKSIGLEYVRQFVRVYDRKTRGAEPAMAANLAVMELDSRTAEAMHWAAALLNIPFVVALFQAHSPWIWLGGTILLGDLYLMLLQRYHRVRVRTTASKRNRRGSQTESEPAEARS